MIIESVRRAARTDGKRDATICGDVTRSWAEVEARVARLAQALVELGARPGDRIGILAQNSDRYLEAIFATWWLGAITVPMNSRWSVEEHIYSIDDADIRIVFHDQGFAETAAICATRRPNLHALIGFAGKAHRGAHDYEDLISRSAPAEPVRLELTAPCGIFYTGGTTGLPKGVVHTHGSITGAALVASLDMQYPRAPRYLHAAPMFHLGDLSQAFMTTLLGGTHIFIPAFNADEVVTIIARHKVQTTLLVPTMIGMVLQSPLLDHADLTSLELIAYGGSPITEPVLRRAREVFSRTRLVQGFGQTESCASGTLLGDEYHTPGAVEGRMRSAGRPSYGVEMEMRDAEGRALGAGEVGEICLRGPMVMAGYWNKPEETATSLRDGWLHTGDAGYVDEDGYLYVCDRVKDMIISGGENVYSAEVERAVATHPKVAQVAVIGVPDEKWGERVHAIVVAKPGTAIEYDEIYTHCKALIAGYKTPRSMDLVAALPLSPVGKVLKTELRKPYWGDNKRAVN